MRKTWGYNQMGLGISLIVCYREPDLSEAMKRKSSTRQSHFFRHLPQPLQPCAWGIAVPHRAQVRACGRSRT